MICPICKTEFHGARERRHAKTCSKMCSRKRESTMYRDSYQIYGLPTGTVGALNELRVSTDLMLRGWSVFRSLSPSSQCDLVLLKNEKVVRVEVTTGRPSPSGKPMYPPHTEDRYNFDVLAVVLGGNTPILYIPSEF